MTESITNFIANDELIITATTLSTMVDLSFNFITNYTNDSTKLQNGIHAFIPGKVVDEITLFSYVSPLTNKINFTESKFILGETPTKVFTFFVYRNNTEIGYLTFEPGKNFAKIAVQDSAILNRGDCFYIKSGNNNPTGLNSDAQNLRISLMFDKQK